jgi:hypothetical protein
MERHQLSFLDEEKDKSVIIVAIDGHFVQVLLEMVRVGLLVGT